MSTMQMESDGVRVLKSSPTKLRRAPFALRCGALLIDYILLIGIVAVATLFARAGGDKSFFGTATMTLGYMTLIVFALFNYVALAAWTGRTVGKWATGLRIIHADAQGVPREIGFARALLRHTVGYALSIITLGLGFLLAVFDKNGRTLHDFVAGTIVVQDT
ncbi:MAG: RDD family protein [Pyrinomonadaceae bacterium]